MTVCSSRRSPIICQWVSTSLFVFSPCGIQFFYPASVRLRCASLLGGQSQSRQPMLGGQDSMAGFNQNNYYPSYQMNAQGMQQENFQRGSPVKLRCKHWATKGQCRMGSDCGFMHSGTPGNVCIPRNMFVIVRVSKLIRFDFCFLVSGDMHMCRHWATKGSCKLGDNCQFAHIGVRVSLLYSSTTLVCRETCLCYVILIILCFCFCSFSLYELARWQYELEPVHPRGGPSAQGQRAKAMQALVEG